MNKIINEIIVSLDKLGNEIINRAGNSVNNNLISTYGWNCPAISPRELSEIPKKIAEQLKKIENFEVLNNKDLIENLQKISNKINLLINNNIAYFYNGNGSSAIPAFLTTMEWIKMQIEPLINFEKISNPNFYPSEIVKRIYNMNEEIHNLMIDKEELETKIKKIQEAYDAASNLPTTINQLRKAEQNINKLKEEALISHSKIEELKIETEKSNSIIKNKEEEAIELTNKCESAYRTTTTQGLAKAFQDKANTLTFSLFSWVVLLISALIVGSIIGTGVYRDLNNYISTNNQNIVTSVIVIKFLISLLSFGAPLWFAWLSTKQISERFKLAEDYAFKASVAKAYEGYRKEATRLDQSFEMRLFNTALTRLEQEPLRFVKNSNHGSPWQELINSKEFQNAVNFVPELKDKVFELTKQGMNKVDLKELLKKDKKIEDN
jgi:hypothetical protein